MHFSEKPRFSCMASLVGYTILEDVTTIHTESLNTMLFSSFKNATTKEFRSMLIQCKK